MLTALRWLILASGVFGLLGGTLLYRRLYAPAMNRWWSYFERPSATVPALLRDERVQRGWAVVSGILLLTLWWFLGTPAGIAAFEDLIGSVRGAA